MALRCWDLSWKWNRKVRNSSHTTQAFTLETLDSIHCVHSLMLLSFLVHGYYIIQDNSFQIVCLSHCHPPSTYIIPCFRIILIILPIVGSWTKVQGGAPESPLLPPPTLEPTTARATLEGRLRGWAAAPVGCRERHQASQDFLHSKQKMRTLQSCCIRDLTVLNWLSRPPELWGDSDDTVLWPPWNFQSTMQPIELPEPPRLTTDMASKTCPGCTRIYFHPRFHWSSTVSHC